MTPTTIIQQAQADGVMLALSPAGTIKAVGNGEAVNRWLPVIREHKAELLDALRWTPEEREIVDWLRRIGEPNPQVIRETLAKCRTRPDWRAAFLTLARDAHNGLIN